MRLLPLGVFAGVLLFWQVLSATHVFPSYAFPSPAEVAQAFQEQLRSGRLYNDLITSLYREAVGFLLAVLLSVPLGLWLGLQFGARFALLPLVNFFRNLSPLAWIPFAILWFGRMDRNGDSPVIFLIFLSSFFPLVLAVTAAVANIPSVYFQVARDFGYRGPRLLVGVTLPAIMPQVITALRVTAGVAWMVVVAAEMIGGKSGLGLLIWDARNGLRLDVLVVAMIVIGLIGVAIDRLLLRLTLMPSVRWGYER
jgi:NitT/TauT family transport system permease protein